MNAISNKEEDTPAKWNTIKLASSFTVGATSLCLLLVTLLVDLESYIIIRMSHISNGSAAHDFLKKDFDSLHLSAYLFNITNADRFLSGEDYKLKVKEVGPFTYREIRTHRDIEFDPEAGVMRYTPRINMLFHPEESIGRPEDINVTLPNIPMLGLTSNTASYSYFARMGLNLLITQLNSQPIVTIDAHSYLWGHYEPLVSLSHTILPGVISFEKMGILDRLTDQTVPNLLELSMRDEDKFLIKTRNGKRKLQMSPKDDPEQCEKCSTFDNAFEGLGYPNILSPDFKLRIYRSGLCRIVDLTYHGKKSMDYGGDALVYHLNDSFFSLDPSQPSNGILELSECFITMPLAFTKSHFTGMDPNIYERIEGMHPDEEKYKSWIAVDPKIGMEIETVFWLQLNLVLKDTSYNHRAAMFSNMVIPIANVKLTQPEVREDCVKALKDVYSVLPMVILGGQVLLYVITLVSCVYFVSLVHCHWACSDAVLTGITFPVTTLAKQPILNIEESLVVQTKFRNTT